MTIPKQATVDNPSEERVERSGNAPPAQKFYGKEWFTTAVVYCLLGMFSLVLRLFRLQYSDNGAPVFDEKHYVPQAEQMLLNGGIENNPGYGLVVHPPLGKRMIASGIELFGYNPIGWRIVAVTCGVATVLLVAGIAHRFSKSISVAVIAGILLNIEGVSLGMTRMGMLDAFLAFFVVLGAFCVAMRLTSGDPLFEVPWYHDKWMLFAGFSFGLAMSVKLSGVYYPAACGIILVIYAAFKSRKVRTTVRATGAGLIYFLLVPLAVFMTSWIKWFADESSVGRHAAEAGEIEHPLPGFLDHIMPNSIRSFWNYQAGVMDFHTSLTTSGGNLHPWESKPTQWLIGNRPMLFLDESSGDTVKQVWLMPNQPLWWLLVPVFVASVAMLIYKREWKWGFVVAGMLIGWGPWAAFSDRQMYLFYTLTLIPFVIIAMSLLVNEVWTMRKDGRWGVVRTTTLSLMGLAGACFILFFVIYVPWYYGMSISGSLSEKMTLFDMWAPLEKKN